MNSIIALIPARSGSKRIPNKNIKRLGKHPLLAYTIEQARQSGIFDEVLVNSDSYDYEQIARHYGVRTWIRHPDYAKDDSPDIEWIRDMSPVLDNFDYFAILRPTNPFRAPAMLQTAWEKYDKGDWLKAVQPVSEHPCKMWIMTEKTMMNMSIDGRESHALPTQVLPEAVVQNGSLEIRPTHDLEPRWKQLFYTPEIMGYDLNTEKDWIYAEWLIEHGRVNLIEIDKEPYENTH